MNSETTNPAVKWLFMGFGLLIAVINAALTAVFSSTYLTSAFGGSDGGGIVPTYMAALYGLLIMDVAYIVWYWVYRRAAVSTSQRWLAMIMAGVSLFASMVATLTQLATNSFGLVDLSAYTDGVGVTALITMLLITTAHIVSFAAFHMMDPSERVKDVKIGAKAKVIDKVLNQLPSDIDRDAHEIVDVFRKETREEVLAELGFTRDLRRVGRLENASAPPTADSKDESQFEQADEFARKRVKRGMPQNGQTSENFS